MEKLLTSPPRRAAMDFLMSHLPPSDWDTCDHALLLQFVDHALALRQTAPWCAELDEELFYHYVLFPRVNDEALTFHRAIFHDALWERVTACPTLEEKVLAVNRWCHECASYESQDERTASPLTVYRCGSGRCGEESAFLVSALRSVGIAARQVYAPRWAHCDDNHAWVEVLCGDTWRFLGACEPEPILDRGWFNAPASRALIVHSRLFGEGTHPLHGERIGAFGGVTYYNQTSRYALTVQQQISVTQNGHPVAGAQIHIQVLNEASLHTIAVLTTGEHGTASVTIGRGDVHILAVRGDDCAEWDGATGENPTLALRVFHNPCADWGKVTYTAPLDAPVNPAPLNDIQKHQRTETLAQGSRIRTARLAAQTSPLFPAARGNAEEILTFLHRDDDPQRETMLQTLTDKDFRDAAAQVLEDHWQHRPAQGTLPDELYFPYVVCPRIAREPLTPWRSALLARYSEQERDWFCAAPMRLWDTLHEQLTPAETYQNLFWTPLAALQAGRCDEKSLRLVFVACLRTWGIPARLRNGVPEYWQNGVWQSVLQEKTAVLTITGGESAQYRQDWTLSRWENGSWTLLEEVEQGAVTLPAGDYRLITAVRMPNGNQFAARRGILLSAGEHQDISLLFCSYALSDLLYAQRLPVMRAMTLSGDTVTDLCCPSDRPSLLLWVEEGGEPTEHLLNELLAARETLNALAIPLVFLLRGRESMTQQTLARTLAALDNGRVLLDDWAYDLEQTARHLSCDPERPPLVVVLDREGNAVYGASGYSVGRVALLMRIVEYLTQQ